MKRIVVLIIASLLVLGVVLPGCGEAHVIKIAVCGPMTDIVGQNHWDGATMAVEEINDAGGVDVGGTMYDIQLVEVETNEILDSSGADGVTALTAVIDDVDFVVGGFRTEAVAPYREVAMDAEKIFMDCGAATGALQFSVVEDYDKYKYWFKATPYNEVFLCTSMLKLTASAIANLVGYLKACEGAGYPYKDEDYAITGAGTKADPYVVKVAIFGETLSWCADIVALAWQRLPTLLMPSKNITLNITGTWLVPDTAVAIGAVMGQIAATKPHAIFTIFSGPVGKVYSKARADYNAGVGLPAMSIGINVEGQLQGMADFTEDGCEYDIMLDTWAENMSITSKTVDWFNDFVDAYDDYPLYTAATYDAIYSLKAAIEATDSLDSDTLVAYLETHAYTGVAGTTAYYPWPAINLGGGNWALNETQVRDLYDLDSYGWNYTQSEWLCAASGGPHIAHDIVYGPGYQTGIGTQWQNVEGTLRKVGWWPALIPGLEALAGLNPLQLQAIVGSGTVAALWEMGIIDQYGFWNFAYDGTSTIQIPVGWWINLP